MRILMRSLVLRRKKVFNVFCIFIGFLGARGCNLRQDAFIRERLSFPLINAILQKKKTIGRPYVFKTEKLQVWKLYA